MSTSLTTDVSKAGDWDVVKLTGHLDENSSLALTGVQAQARQAFPQIVKIGAVDREEATEDHRDRGFEAV